jgi:uroporphyrinogen-III synthase
VVEIEAHSCISLQVNQQEPPKQTDWVFFSSPAGVGLFFEHFSIRDTTRIGVLGPGTLKALEGRGYAAKYVSESADPEEAITAFCRQLAPSERVLVPRSEISLQRFKGLLREDQLVDFPFYSNLPAPPQKQFEGDVLIFTSPSNARAYFSVHRLMNHQRIVAIGQSTYDALRKCTPGPLQKSEAPTEEAMWAAVLRKTQ